MSAGDLLIRGAHVIDASLGWDGVADIVVRDGRIAGVGSFPDATASTTIDADGLVASAGWVDLHVHCFVGWHDLAVEPDTACGVASGVTTVVDTGSATASTFDGLRRVAESAVTRVLTFLNVSALPGDPIHGDWTRFDQKRTIATVEANRDLIVGIKVLASQRHVGNLGMTPLSLGVQASREADTGLMVHIGMAPPVIQEVLDALAAGDIVTHCFKGYPRGIMNRHGRPVPEAWAALERGVLFDTGHGQDSYTFEAHRQALAAGFPLTSLSTDLHRGNLDGPVHSLHHTMSKALHLGHSLAEVIRMVTLAPARSVGRDGEFGSLRPGSCADVTLFRIDEGALRLRDSEGNEEVAERGVAPVATVRAGEVVMGAEALSVR